MLTIHRGDRADVLVAALAELLSARPDDPFQPDVVAVPTRGMERWLAQQLSGWLGVSQGGRDGVCANVEFPSPRRLTSDAVAALSGLDPLEDPWRAERAAWPLLDVIEAALGEPWLATLSGYLRGAGEEEAYRADRRLGAARHLAALFERYARDRPEMLRSWRAGIDDDGEGRPLPPDAAWQAELWRRLRERIGGPDPAERVVAACARLREEPGALDLPGRVSLFGVTRIPPGDLDTLRALASGRDVHLFLLHPSAALWQRLEGQGPVRRRADDPTVTVPAHPLAASWGHDVRELQLVLCGGDGDRQVVHHATAAGEATLLERIQAGVRADRTPPGPPLPGEEDARPLLDPADDSVQVHACHGRARQVEVLRDALLHAFASDPTLEPRDVVVMCPDIETFAPLVHAAFGTVGEATGDGADVPLRVRLADRSLRQTNPVLGVVAELLELAGSRVTASEVLDLADREPVRRRFRLDDDDLTRLEEWVRTSGIRWGLDPAGRAPYGLQTVPEGTWRAGLDRLLLGVAMSEDGHRLYGGVLPVDDMESGAVDLAGRLAELIDRLDAVLAALRAEQPVASWATAIAAAADALTAARPRDAWQHAELHRLLDDLVEQSEDAAVELTLGEVRGLLADRLQGRPTRANFRTGHLTVCTLTPMRSVPHRVVCLLGLDDGVFPRRAPRDGDDLTLVDPRVGERDGRTEDRQLLLDALMAATSRLIVTYTGNDERTNTPRPPAVPVGELLDVVDATVRLDDPDVPARERVRARHPLQPFDPRNFAAARPWSFDEVMLEGARALAAPRAARATFLEGRLEPPDTPAVRLDDLVRFVEHPVRAFLRQRLGISLGDWSEEPADGLPTALDNLELWGVGQRLLEARLRGADPPAAVRAERARGQLPPGKIADPELNKVGPVVESIVAAVAEAVGERPATRSVDVKVALAGGRRLTGTVPGVVGTALLQVAYSRLAPKHRLAAWVRFLAWVATAPDLPIEAVTIGRGKDRGTVGVARLTAPGEDPVAREAWAVEQLDVLADLHRRGLCEALPLACRASAAFAEAVLAGEDPLAAAGGQWGSGWNFAGEDRDPEHVMAFGGERPLDWLTAEFPRTDETWEPGEPTRFGRLALRLWRPLLECEEVTVR